MWKKWEWILQMKSIIKPLQLCMYVSVKVCVSFHWTSLDFICSLFTVCMCLCALRGPVQLSGLVCRWLSWGLLKENVYLSLFPFLCHILVPSPPFCVSINLPVTPWLPTVFHHCICWEPSWAEESFPLSVFCLRSSLCASQGLVRQLYMVALEWNVS